MGLSTILNPVGFGWMYVKGLSMILGNRIIMT